MLCKKCGSELEENALFCRFCGNRKEEAESVSVAGSVVEEAVESEVKENFEIEQSADIVEDSFSANSNENLEINPAKSKAKYILIFVAVIVIAAIIGAAAIGIGKRNDYTEYTTYDNYVETEEATDDSSCLTEVQDDDKNDDVNSVYTKDVRIVSVKASSFLAETNITHSAERVCDNDVSTAWSEGSPGQGIGESLTIKFDKDYLLEEIAINAGYQRRPELYMENSRPNRITFLFSDGTNEIHYLDDICDIQHVKLNKAVVADEVIITIDSVYPGDAYEDTCISEIRFNTQSY